MLFNNRNYLAASLHNHFENDEWLKDLFDNAHDLIQVVQIDGTILYVNLSWANKLEYPVDEILGRSLYHFIDEQDREKYHAYRDRIIGETSVGERIVFNMQAKSGRKISVEGLVSLKKSADGEPLYTRGIFRDISERVQNEAKLSRLYEELKEREQNLHQLLLHAPDAVVVIDAESHITYWNPKAEELFGWSAAEVLGQPLSRTIVPPQYREGHAAGMRRYMQTGQAHVLNQTIEITALNKAGKEFFVSLTISQTLQKGRIAFIAFLRNITEQKNNQLELEKKTKELERSNTNLEEFAHAASHDLKEPIRKVQTFASRLRESLDDKMTHSEKDYFNRLETASRRMASLVDDLLEYSHVTKEENLLEPVDLNERLQIAVEDLEVAIEEKGAQLSIDALPVVKGNKRQLQQLFQNLLSNAIKYSRPDVVPQISITADVVEKGDSRLEGAGSGAEGSYYLIQVKDNGIGFEPKDAGRIFKMFQRLHGKGEYSGTGIGLSIARKVVESHKGFITAEGVPGQGATFRVFLPV